MYIYAQQGHGKKDRLETGLGTGALSGVILSPYHEKPENLAALVDKLRNDFSEKAQLLVDPQFYVSTLPEPKQGRLPGYPYFRQKLTRTDFSPASMQDYVASAIDYQAGVGVTRILTPTVHFQSFDDAWSTLAFQLAQASADYRQQANLDVPVLASFVFDMAALKSPLAVNAFLNDATLLDVDGFYIVVGSPIRTSRDEYDETSLANLMRLVNVLAEHNEFEVVCGYTDIVGLLLHSVGARATGVGWSNTTRRFTLSNWDKDIKQGGGGMPPARYTSAKLLTTLSVASDLSSIAGAGKLADVTSNTSFDRTLASGPRQSWLWTHDTACLHHWTVLAEQAREVSSQGSTAGNLRAAENIVRSAIRSYDSLRAMPAISLDASAWRPNLDTWLRAIDEFRRTAGI